MKLENTIHLSSVMYFPPPFHLRIISVYKTSSCIIDVVISSVRVDGRTPNRQTEIEEHRNRQKDTHSQTKRERHREGERERERKRESEKSKWGESVCERGGG